MLRVIGMELLDERPVWSMSGAEMLAALDQLQADLTRRQVRRLELLAALDANGHAKDIGAGDTVRLLSVRHRLDPRDVRHDLRLATALPKYPTVSAALTSGTDSTDVSQPPTDVRLNPAQAQAIVSALEKVPVTAMVPIEDLQVAEEQMVKAGRFLSSGWKTHADFLQVMVGAIGELTHLYLPAMEAAGHGRILNVASLAGLVHPAGMAPYNAVKAGVVALTETLGHELSPYGVGASVVCPSYFRTNLMDSLRGADEALGAVVTQLVERSPLTADDIAAAVLAGIDRDEELIVPDPFARQAWELKQRDRPAYDALMRAQAAKLEERS